MILQISSAVQTLEVLSRRKGFSRCVLVSPVVVYVSVLVMYVVWCHSTITQNLVDRWGKNQVWMDFKIKICHKKLCFLGGESKNNNDQIK